jgi:hypothetical protein
MMTTKAFVTNALVTETQQGLVRMQETKGQPLFAVLREYPEVLRLLLRAPAALAVAGLIFIVGIYRMVSRTFWSILVTERIGIPPEHLALFSFARSVIMLLFLFFVMPRLRNANPHRVLALGLLGLIASYALLIGVPPMGYALLLLSTVLEACSLPLASTLLQKLVVLAIDAKERARIMSILYVLVMVFTSPFGWIAGRISEIDRNLPFVLSIGLFVVGILLAYLASRLARAHTTADGVAEQVASASS